MSRPRAGTIRPRALAATLCLLGAGCAGRTPPAPAPTAAPPPAATSTPAASPAYVDATAEAGLTAISWCGSPSRDHLLESVGSGAAFVDLDGDGLDDIVTLSGWRLADRDGGGPPRKVLARGGLTYYRNLGGGRFTDATAEAGLDARGAWAIALAAGDIDGDGDLDLFVTTFGANLLFMNRGDGTFEEVGARAGVADTGWWGGASLFDADGDGDLDLYVTSYIDATMDEVLSAERTLLYKGQVQVMVGPFGMPGGADRFYRNRGDGTFEEATDAAGLTDVGRGYGLASVAADLDGDGDQDLYVANDSNPNYLFRNEGGGHFSEIGVVSGAAFSADGAAQASMGVEVADLDGDGVLDLFVNNFSDDDSAVYRGEGDLFFSDVSVPTKVAALTYRNLKWGAAVVDFDQDARPDVVVADGHIYPQADLLSAEFGFKERNLLLLNRPPLFEDASGAAGEGWQTRSSFRGLAVGDLENDGDPDLLFTRIDEPPLLLRYDGADPSRWITVEPVRPYPRWIGSRVEVFASGTRQSRVILAGGSYASQSSLKAIFSVGAAGRADRVVVTFAGGGSVELKDVKGGTRLKVDVPR
ncbi:MAG: CRTAC1 family protein [Acidobacteria bacterium]|nr:CRTAC1 family protein [Acidobacteriota bacterium]